MTEPVTWYYGTNIRVKGFIRSGSGYLAGNDLAEYFSSSMTTTEFEQKLASANGQFSVIIRRGMEVWAAVDRVRNYPLFYMNSDDGWIISEDCYKLAALMPGKQLNPLAASSFLSSGFVTGRHTLIEDIFQVEAGSFIVLNDEAISSFYHDSAAVPINDISITSAKAELIGLIHDVFRSHFKALNNRFIAIPLSGGYDSRLVAAMCAKYHPENVICYTYGTLKSPETVLAKEAAARTGLKWINIVYNEELIRDFMHDEYFEKYFPYVSQLSSMFFMQEYFAVRYLKEKNLIPDNCVFMPGFSGDMLAGSHLSPDMSRTLTPDQTAELIFRDFFRLMNISKKERLTIIHQIARNISSELLNKWKAIESWDMKERQSKFIVNSAKAYRFFGYEYVIPFWDKSLIDFFSQLPFELKLDKKLYDMVLVEEVFKMQNLNMESEISPSPRRKEIQRIKDNLKLIMPSWATSLLIKKESPIFYDEITKYLIKDFGSDRFKSPTQANYYNSYITQWYLMRTIKDLGIVYNL